MQLFIREGIELPPMILGGGQEEGRRSGTVNVPGVVGLGAAADIANQRAGAIFSIAVLRDRFEKREEAFPDVVIHGLSSPRLANTSCFSVPKLMQMPWLTRLPSGASMLVQAPPAHPVLFIHRIPCCRWELTMNLQHRR